MVGIMDQHARRRTIPWCDANDAHFVFGWIGVVAPVDAGAAFGLAMEQRHGPKILAGDSSEINQRILDSLEILRVNRAESDGLNRRRAVRVSRREKDCPAVLHRRAVTNVQGVRFIKAEQIDAENRRATTV